MENKKEMYREAFELLEIAFQIMDKSKGLLSHCNEIVCWSEQKNGQLELIRKNLNDLLIYMYE